MSVSYLYCVCIECFYRFCIISLSSQYRIRIVSRCHVFIIMAYVSYLYRMSILVQIVSVSYVYHIDIVSVSFLCCIVCVSYVYHVYIVSVSYVYHIYIVCVSCMCHIYIVSVSFVYHVYIVSVSYMCHVYIVSVLYVYLNRYPICIVCVPYLYRIYIMALSYFIVSTPFQCHIVFGSYLSDLNRICILFVSYCGVFSIFFISSPLVKF